MRIIIIVISIFFPLLVMAQDTIVKSEENIEYYIIQGDTIPRSAIDLNEVIVFKPLKKSVGVT